MRPMLSLRRGDTAARAVHLKPTQNPNRFTTASQRPRRGVGVVIVMRRRGTITETTLLVCSLLVLFGGLFVLLI